MLNKTCKQCGQSKPISMFHAGAGYVMGVRPICAECTKEKHKSSYQKKPPEYFEQRRAAAKALKDAYLLERSEAIKKKKEDLKAVYADRASERRKEERKRWREKRKLERSVPMARRIEKTNAKHGDKGKLSKDIVDRLLVKQDCKCAYCSADITKERDIDHIVPLGLGGPNIDENIQLLCKPCNRAKSMKHPSEFISLIGT